MTQSASVPGMSKVRVAVLKVLSNELSVTGAAAEYGYSRQHLHRLLTRYRDGGLDAVEPRSRRGKSNPAATPTEVRERIVELRLQLAKDGLDAGPVTITWHLQNEGHRPPSTSTIRRILHDARLITPEPRKRPRSSYHRITAAQPNECRQSDFTHWRLTDGSDVEILNWLDDHSRLLLSCTAFKRVTDHDVINTFSQNINEPGLPAATLTDNGSVYTARFVGGKNGFEYLLALLGITQKNGHPGHTQTKAKSRDSTRHRNKWLAQQPPATTLTELQHQLDRFHQTYNQHRPHRELDRHTPAATYTALPKATAPGHGNPEHYRLRHDRLDTLGKMSFRRAGRMHHLGIGADHKGKRVLAIADDTTITVIEPHTAQALSTHLIEPDKTYWRNQQRNPGRWPRLH